MPLNESSIEQLTIELLQKVGFSYASPEGLEPERPDLAEVVLRGRLVEAVKKLNPDLSEEVRNYAVSQLMSVAQATDNVIENNRAMHRLLTEGVPVEVLEGGHMRGRTVRVIDWEHTTKNDILVTNQFFIKGLERNKIPDVVIFINGLPLVVIELKDATNENATVQKAFTQIHNYQQAVPDLFAYNGILVISDGLDARAGTITSGFDRFMAWKSIDGKRDARHSQPQIETLVLGMLRPYTLLDLIRNYTVFETEKKTLDDGSIDIRTMKKVAAYHQYFAVEKAIDSTLRATSADHRAGVVWHTQGSGKSLSMVFYAGKIIQRLNNPTIVVLTDRNDLDQQLFDTFACAKDLLRQEPVQADSRADLKKLLATKGGGVVFTTIQKFSLENGETEYSALTERSNIVVMADEAHRTQYGFDAKLRETDKGAILSYGFAKYVRDALPNASFIGFTGTPIEKDDANTRTVFGEYVDIYDIQAAVNDHATVKIFYESRLAKLHFKEEEKAHLDYAVDEIFESEETTVSDKAKAKWAQLEAVVGHQARVKDVAKDIVEHFDARQQVFSGKAMIVAMSRRIAVLLYEEIVRLRPEWHSDNRKEGALKVVMTAASSDPEEYQPHHTNKEQRKELAQRFKDVKDPLKLVIVRDMWLTGFDVPCLHTMYVDKPMSGANLMQAIARVNRVYNDKPGGLIVDYIGIASDLKEALVNYTENGGKGAVIEDQTKDVVPQMLAKLETIYGILNGPKWLDLSKNILLLGSPETKLKMILDIEEFLLADTSEKDNRKDRFIKEVITLSKLFALAMPSKDAVAIREEVAFFQAVKARLIKLASDGGSRDVDVESTIRQLVGKAVVSQGIVDIFDASGIKKPDISILSEDFLEEIRGMERKNIALELLKRILNDEIRGRGKKNTVQARKFSEMLQASIKRYQNNLLTAAQVIEELINLAKDIQTADKEGKDLGLSEDEIAFYDALAQNESATKILGNNKLRDLARVLVGRVRENATIDWNVRESARARMRVMVRRLLNQYGYPPDAQEIATDTVLKQAELMAGEMQ
ncbi:type I restriction endonuclease subunit R [Patescibacteria group bacterium]|nr:type I restriction endonuclease subunit R [Patescibacteria group bacterium]